MNLSLSHLRVHPAPAREEPRRQRAAAATIAIEQIALESTDTAQIRRLRSLLSLFALYAAALFVVILFSDGPDIGCILTGIAGHVLYASGKTAVAWREATWLEAARLRIRSRIIISSSSGSRRRS
jgi:hypothetical protein